MKIKMYFWYIASIIMLAMLIMSVNNQAQASTSNPQLYSTIINYAAQKTQLPPKLITAVIQHESNGDYLARSNKNAIGLMQLVPRTGGKAARKVFAHETGIPSKKFLVNPWNNIVYGSAYLKSLMGIFGSFPYKVRVALALAAYNWGVTNVSRQLQLSTQPPLHYWEFKPWAQGHLPQVTQKYVFGIMKKAFPGS